MKPLEQVSARGQSVWIDSLSREMLETGSSQELDRRGLASSGSRRTRRSSRRRSEGEAGTTTSCKELADEEDLSEVFIQLASRDIEHACDLMRAGVRPHRRRRRVRLDGGRPDARARHAGDARPGAALPRGDRPAEPLREDPGDEGRPPRDRGVHRPGQVDQRDADLLARALRRRAGGVRARGGAAARERRRHHEGALRRELLRLARRHRGGQAPRGDRHRGGARRARASSRSRTPSSPTSTGSRSPRPSAGRRSRRPARSRSAACGPPPRRRTRSTATSSTSRS